MLSLANIFLFFVAVTGALSEICGKPNISPDRHYHQTQRIIGGHLAENRSWPGVVGLIMQKPGYFPSHFCGGTLIDKQWVLTASHCIDSLDTDEIIESVRVVVGTGNLVEGLFRKPTQKLHSISHVVKHEGYDDPYLSHNNDIALLKLAKPVTLSLDVQPLCLPNHSVSTPDPKVLVNKLNKRRVCFVAGWGRKKEDYHSSRPVSSKSDYVNAGSEDLLQTDVEMYNKTECRAKLKDLVYVNDMTMICGGFDVGGKGTCNEDSGGPLICKNAANIWELFGVVASGNGCARPNAPGIYANVHFFRTWIQNAMKKN